MGAHSLPTPIPHQISPHRGSLSLKSNVTVCCLPLLAISNASDMQAEMANFSQLVNQITDRFITSIQSIKASSLVRETRLIECRGREIRTPDLLLPKQAR